MATTIQPIAENIFGVATPCGDDIEVRALLVCGERFSLLIDTLLRPADLDGVREFVATRDRQVLLANSHADWDHWWGNDAFPEAPIFAHRLTQVRQIKEGRKSLAAQQKAQPQAFADVILRPATIAWEGSIDIDLGGLSVEMHLLPGHTGDCTVAYIREKKLLFAGDVAEDPIPLLNEGPVGDWPEQLDVWAERVRTVVPAHGKISGPELLSRNAAYLRGLREGNDAPPPELRDALPFYRRAHTRNRKRARPKP